MPWDDRKNRAALSERLPADKTACCIGRQTAEEAAKQGFEEIRTAEKATLDSLIKTLEVDEK